MSTIIATLPKVELYCRLTDAMDRIQATKLAKAYDLPEGSDEAKLEERLKVTDPASFLAASAWQAGLVRSSDDLQELAFRTANRLIQHAVVHAEFAVSPLRLPCDAQEAFDAIEDGVMEALEEQEDAFFSWSVVAEFERGADTAKAKAAFKAWHEAAEERLCAVALVGDESVSAESFDEVAAAAREAGVGVAVQAGLTGRARKFADAKRLQADRILHGIGIHRAEEALTDLRARRVAIMVAPALEAALGRVRSIAKHPISQMQDHGLFVTVASVSPGLLKCDLTGQLEALSKHQSWRLDAHRNTMLRSVEAAFMRPTDRFIIARAVENWRHRPKLTAGGDDSGFGM